MPSSGTAPILDAVSDGDLAPPAPGMRTHYLIGFPGHDGGGRGPRAGPNDQADCCCAMTSGSYR